MNMLILDNFEGIGTKNNIMIRVDFSTMFLMLFFSEKLLSKRYKSFKWYLETYSWCIFCSSVTSVVLHSHLSRPKGSTVPMG